MTKSGAITLGTHIAALAAGWNACNSVRQTQKAIDEAESLNYRAIEIPLTEALLASTPRFQTRERGTNLWTYTALPDGMHMPLRPEHARAWLSHALAWTEAADGRVMGGALAWSPGHIAQVRSAEADRALVVEVLRDVALEAARRGISLAIEPANRYETSVCNTLADGVTLIQEIDQPNVHLLANSYHMHLEEADIAAALQAGCAHMIGIHLAENTGGRLGSGAVTWNSIWQTLGVSNYDGALLVTPWSHSHTTTLQAEGIHSAASDALRFLRSGVRAMQPPTSLKPPPQLVATEEKPKRTRATTKSYRGR